MGVLKQMVQTIILACICSFIAIELSRHLQEANKSHLTTSSSKPSDPSSTPVDLDHDQTIARSVDEWTGSSWSEVEENLNWLNDHPTPMPSLSDSTISSGSSFLGSTFVTSQSVPLTTGVCNDHGIVVNGTCRCDDGWLTSSCGLRYDFSIMLGATFNIKWTYDATYIYVQLRNNGTTGWLGIILGPGNGGMISGDCWSASVGNTYPNIVSVRDRWSNSNDDPGSDGQQDLQDATGWQNLTTGHKWTHVSFRRKLNTGDSADRPFTVGMAPQVVSYAFGRSDTFDQHLTSDRAGNFLVDWMQPKGSPTPPVTVTSVASTYRSVTIQWTGSVYSGSGTIISYTVQCESSPGSGSYVNGYVGLPQYISTGPYVYQAVVSGLASSSTYLCRVAGQNDNPYYGVGNFSVPTSATTLSPWQREPLTPAAPTFISAAPYSVTVGWTAPPTNGTAIIGYQLSYAHVGSSSYTTFSGTFDASAVQGALTGLSVLTNYTIRVAATSIAGPSPWSPPLTAGTTNFTGCNNNCNGHGTCVQSLCRCDLGYVDADCGKKAQFNACNAPNNLCIYWTYDATNIYLQFVAYSSLTAWFGWIIAPDVSNGMFNGDCWNFIPNVGISSSTLGPAVNLEDRWSPSTVAPTMDLKQDFFDTVSFVRAAAGTTTQSMVINARRALNTGDSADKPIVSGDMRVSWAIGPSIAYAEHAHTAAGQGKMTINFLQPYASGPPTPPLFSAPIVTAATTTSLTWQFQPSLLNGSSPITKYDVYVLQAATLTYVQSATFTGLSPSAEASYITTNTLSHVTVSEATFSVTTTGLTSSTCYPALVQASNTNGASNFSAPVSICTLSASDLPPSTPAISVIQLTNVVAGSPNSVASGAQTTPLLAADQTTITIGWPTLDATLKASPLSLVSYTVQMQLLASATTAPVAGSWVSVYTGITPSYSMINLQSDSVYAIQLSARNVVGSSSFSGPLLIHTLAYAACPNNCNGHGTCVQSQCRCDVGYVDSDCGMAAPFSACNALNNLCIYWTYDTSNIYLQFESFTPITGWYGWILDPDVSGGMNNGDCFTFFPKAGISTSSTGTVISLEDRFSANTLTPTLDALQDFVAPVSWVRAATTTKAQSMVVNTKRLLNTGDSADKAFVTGDMRVSWAIGPALTYDEHAHTANGQGKMLINFLQPFATGPPTPPLFAAPIVMAATMTSLTFRWVQPKLNGSTPILSYDAYLLQASTLAYVQSTAFSQLADQVTYANTNAISHVTVNSGIFTTSTSGLTASTCYPALVFASNSNGAGNFSVPTKVCTISASDLPPTTPDISVIQLINPASGGATSVSSGTQATPLVANNPTQISVGWPTLDATLTSSSLSLVGYTVQVQLLSSSTATPTATGWVTVYTGIQPSFNVSNLQPGSVYAIRLGATNVVGASSYSSPLQIETASYGACLNSCTSQGMCVKGVCVCYTGFLGPDCSLVATTTTLSSSPLLILSYAVDGVPAGGSSGAVNATGARRLLSSPSGTLYVGLETTASATNGQYAGLIIGCDATDGMSNGDTWFLTYDGASASAYDRWSTGQITPTMTKDTTQDLMNVKAAPLTHLDGTSTGTLAIQFERAINTGDSGDSIIVDALTEVSWAFGPTQSSPGSAFPDFLQHTSSERGKLQLNFFSNQIVTVPAMTMSFFIPFPIIIGIITVLTFVIRNIGSVRRSKVVQSILHQPILSAIYKCLSSLCMKGGPPELSKTGYRQHWFDTLTLDIRRSLTELSIGEFMFITSYGIALIVITSLAKVQFDSAARAWWYYWGDLTALHLALAILPVSRTSIWLYTCGISFERAVKWHRWIARISIICVCIHAAQCFNHIDTAILLAIPAVPTVSGGGNIYGLLAMIGMLAMTLFAFEQVRRFAFRVFYYSHLALIIPTYVFACLHSKTCLTLCVPPIALYGLDRLLRFSRSIRQTKIVGLEVIEMDHGTAAIHIQMYQEGFKFQPGQYVFLNIPQISLFDWHPFSISSSNAVTGSFSLHILSHTKGFDTIKAAAKQFQFDHRTGFRGSDGICGIGELVASSNQLQAFGSGVKTNSRPPPLPSSHNSPSVAPTSPSIAPYEPELMPNPLHASGAAGRLPPPLPPYSARPPLIAPPGQSPPSSPSLQPAASGQSAPVSPRVVQPESSEIELDTSLKSFNWTSELYLQSMKYFVKCSNYVSAASTPAGGKFPPGPPPLMTRVDGPYGYTNAHMKEDYHTIILVAGGIGITPFFSVLYDLLNHVGKGGCPIHSVHLVWVCGRTEPFHHIHPQLWKQIQLNPHFHLHFYATKGKKGGPPSEDVASRQLHIQSGRPNLKQLFPIFVSRHRSSLSLNGVRVDPITDPTASTTNVHGVEVEMHPYAQSGLPRPPSLEEGHSATVLPSAPAMTDLVRPSSAPDLTIGAFCCGPSALVADVEEFCLHYQVQFHKEVFEM